MQRSFVLPLSLLAVGCFYDPPSVAAESGDESSSSRGDGGETNPTTSAPSTTSPATGEDTGPPPDGDGRVVYQRDGRLYLLTLGESGGTRDISDELGSLGWPAAGEDPYINISDDGEWLLVETERAHPNCEGWACLAVVRTDMSEGEALLAGTEAMHSEAGADVSSGGDLVVFSAIGTENATDLFVTTRDESGWTPPTVITAQSPYGENRQPTLSPDGTRVLFDCGDIGDRSICVVGTDGSGLDLAVFRGDHPGGDPGDLHHGSYGPDGGIVFEASWPDESIWYRSSDWSTLAPRGGFENDNSPCVLPDRSIVSLWLARPENPNGLHELKLMSADGSAYEMLVTGVDIFDVGLGCGA